MSSPGQKVAKPDEAAPAHDDEYEAIIIKDLSSKDGGTMFKPKNGKKVSSMCPENSSSSICLFKV